MDNRPLTILVAGDDQKTRRLAAFGLSEGAELTRVSTPDELRKLSSLECFDVALIDWEMKTADSAVVLQSLQDRDDALPVVVTAAVEAAAERARELGADDCLLKPFSIDDLRQRLVSVARRAPAAPAVEEPAAVVPAPVETAPAAHSRADAETADAADAADSELSSQNPVMQKLLQVAWRVAPTPATVLILGENGTGKTVLAQAIHQRSLRRRMPFVTVNCPCLQPQLLESELFGHVRGAFTGAVSDAIGKVATAEGGTLFLDEIGELPLEIQPKLLRLLQDRRYERVGESKTRQADIRVLAATNRDLREEVRAGRFREDLYYRLNVITLDVLPLRQRPEDIVPTAEHFLAGMRVVLNKKIRGFTLMANEALSAYAWPGNLRELRNAVERAAILTDREWLDVEDFPVLLQPRQATIPQVGDLVSLTALEENHIREVIARTATLDHAARVLGIDKSTLYRKRKRMPAPRPARIEDFAGGASASAFAS